MALLLEDDYVKLTSRSIMFEESEPNRYFIFLSYILLEGLFSSANCDVLVVIPPNYNQGGNDMFWTHPALTRRDGRAIPAANVSGGGDNRNWQGKEYCRWSRHWNPPSPAVWRPGKDDIISIYRRIDWALRNPDAQ